MIDGLYGAISLGWDRLNVSNAGIGQQITALDVSKIPANKVYYGTQEGRVFRLDNANDNTDAKTTITGTNFPTNAYTSLPASTPNPLMTFALL